MAKLTNANGKHRASTPPPPPAKKTKFNDNYDALDEVELDDLLSARKLDTHKLKWGKIQHLRDNDKMNRHPSPHNLPPLKEARKFVSATKHSKKISTGGIATSSVAARMPSSVRATPIDATDQGENGEQLNPSNEELRHVAQGRIRHLTTGQLVALNTMMDDWHVGIPFMDESASETEIHESIEMRALHSESRSKANKVTANRSLNLGDSDSIYNEESTHLPRRDSAKAATGTKNLPKAANHAPLQADDAPDNYDEMSAAGVHDLAAQRGLDIATLEIRSKALVIEALRMQDRHMSFDRYTWLTGTDLSARAKRKGIEINNKKLSPEELRVALREKEKEEEQDPNSKVHRQAAARQTRLHITQGTGDEYDRMTAPQLTELARTRGVSVWPVKPKAAELRSTFRTLDANATAKESTAMNDEQSCDTPYQDPDSLHDQDSRTAPRVTGPSFKPRHVESGDKYDRMGALELRHIAKSRQINYSAFKLKCGGIRAALRERDEQTGYNSNEEELGQKDEDQDETGPNDEDEDEPGPNDEDEGLHNSPEEPDAVSVAQYDSMHTPELRRLCIAKGIEFWEKPRLKNEEMRAALREKDLQKTTVPQKTSGPTKRAINIEPVHTKESVRGVDRTLIPANKDASNRLAGGDLCDTTEQPQQADRTRIKSTTETAASSATLSTTVASYKDLTTQAEIYRECRIRGISAWQLGRIGISSNEDLVKYLEGKDAEEAKA
ncbi:hypothetical protein EJ08DRAFT_703159 [Tothia fuscella]|uniref:Uncharacterized protein n=1 Tax=Tothia fuscella TaxID=1048955 RepID=A0A9P4NF23_9PEZI|nr:hypothetical protein EJ08DRAFT_703159 [Tothia fuscella]